MTDFEEAEQEAYRAAKHAFDVSTSCGKHRNPAKSNMIQKRDHNWNMSHKMWRPAENPEKFFSFEEFSHLREEFCGMGRVSLVTVYKELLKQPVQESIDVNLQVRNALDQMRGRPNLRGITYHWASMDSYWKWIAQVSFPRCDILLLVLMAL